MWSEDNKEDLFTLSAHSNKKVNLICKDCGKIKSITCNNFVNRKTLSCKCGDSQSFPNKFINCLLSQLKISFETEKKFDWSNKRIYDFYIEELNLIIEAHGEQHYSKCLYTKKGRTLEEEQENDKLKEQLARENGIENYIQLDCRVSSLDWIKNSTLHSELKDILNLSNVNWEYCEEYALKNIIKEICLLWNAGKYSSIKDFAKEIGLHSTTISSYLKKGNEYGWCRYSVEEAIRKGSISMSKKVYSKTLDREFNSIDELSNYLGKSHRILAMYLNRVRKPTRWFSELQLSYIELKK